MLYLFAYKQASTDTVNACGMRYNLCGLVDVFPLGSVDFIKPFKHPGFGAPKDWGYNP